jgi:hypothetical protein
LLPLVTCLDVTAALMEEVLRNALPEKDPHASEAITNAHMVM